MRQSGVNVVITWHIDLQRKVWRWLHARQRLRERKVRRSGSGGGDGGSGSIVGDVLYGADAGVRRQEETCLGTGSVARNGSFSLIIFDVGDVVPCAWMDHRARVIGGTVASKCNVDVVVLTFHQAHGRIDLSSDCGRIRAVRIHTGGEFRFPSRLPIGW